ncbi:MAG: hypothetical protein QMD12_00360 [Candidatus Aenigmarchaeota archaeon]|nr:hypothetical protein [Candidatus Aenigmarchaeota archaeon]
MVFMEKPEVIRKFLEKGCQLDSESLNFFYQSQGKINHFLTKIEKLAEKPTTVTFDLVKKLLEIKEKEYDVEVIKKVSNWKGVAAVGDLIDFLLRRYESMKRFLVNRLDLINPISINKITQKTRKFSLIAMVKEKNEDEKSLIVEDTTGELTVFFDEKVKDSYDDLVLDEVLGLVCEKENGTVKVKDLLFPDIPLKREINKTKEDVFCLFVSDLHMDSDDFLRDSYEKFLSWVKKTDYEKFYIFVLGDVSKEEEDIKNFFGSLPDNSFKIFLKGAVDPDIQIGDLTLRDPSMLKIENVICLVCHGDFFHPYQTIWKNKTAENILLNLLKKRHINPVFSNRIYEKDPFLLDLVPDIFVSGFFHYPSAMNYKGTTIITTGSFVSEPIFWLINLRTREIIKLNFT